MTYSQNTWQACQAIYEMGKLEFVAQTPGIYLLMHTATKKTALGDPSVDVANGGQIDAFEQFETQHGFSHGEFFGVRIPAQLP